MPLFERMDSQSLDWDEMLNTCGDRTIFQTPAWLAFIAKTQNAEPVVAVLNEGSQSLGYFAGLTVEKLGVKILGSPLRGDPKLHRCFGSL